MQQVIITSAWQLP